MRSLGDPRRDVRFGVMPGSLRFRLPALFLPGIVIAGVGDGNMTKPALDALAAAAKKGLLVVRSTRLPMGMVMRNAEVDDDKLAFVASGELNPAKSRVRAQLALTKTHDPVLVQQMFYRY